MAYLGNGLEHRWGERVGVNIPVSVSVTALERADGCVTNLSLSGALMKSASEMRLNILIEVRIDLPQPMLRTAVLEAYVSRKLNDGVGIEWCQFAPKIVKDLLRDPSVRDV